MHSIVHAYEVIVLTLLAIQLFAFSHVQLTGFSTSGSPNIAACVARPPFPAGREVWSGHETRYILPWMSVCISKILVTEVHLRQHVVASPIFKVMTSSRAACHKDRLVSAVTFPLKGGLLASCKLASTSRES